MRLLTRLWLGGVVALGILLSLAACDDASPSPTPVKMSEAQKSQEAANSIRFEENAERDNIKRRLELTADPGKLGFIVLLNQMGQPIVYEGVKGKVTSSHKRLTSPEVYNTYYTHWGVAPADEGTYGSSDDYIYYWNTEGVYRQWSGLYLYSDQPMRLSQPTLVIHEK